MVRNTITTYKGVKIDPINPLISDILIDDIAHALSLICRANGHLTSFYSVAEHSINCAKEAKARNLSARLQLLCLLHDASEAYIGDITRPFKKQLPIYFDIETNLQNTILDALGLTYMTDKEIKQVKDIDDSLLYHEFITLNGDALHDTALTLCMELTISERPFKESEEEFILLYNELKIIQ